MRLSAYLSEKSLTKTAFAQTIGVSVEAVRRYCELERFPRPDVMVRIEAETEGSVTYRDFAQTTAVEPAA